ncbi:MAG: hypothetical protein EA358_00655 [Flavobacteriales bacterium]|nr:MAG: hypothetical protein EA358_00655 [Flavobacteriales bacterium]
MVQEGRRERTPQRNLQTSRSNEIGAESAAAQAPPVQKPVIKDKKYGRNDIVSVQNLTSGERKQMKYKQAMPLLEDETWVIIEE